MSEQENTEILKCPSCGAPRLGHAWDCAKCGAVFDGKGGEEATTDGSAVESSGRQPVGTPKRSSSARRASSARRPGAAPRKSPIGGSIGGLTAIRQWVADNKAVAVIISFVIYIGVIWLFSALIIGATDSPGAIKSAYRDLTGRPLPDGFGPTFAAHFVSRKLVVLDRPDQVLLVLYRDADGSSTGELNSFTEGVLDTLEVPFEKIRTRTATVGAETIEVPVLELWGEGGPHLYLVPTETMDGGRAVEAVVGAPDTVLEIVEEMVRER